MGLLLAHVDTYQRNSASHSKRADKAKFIDTGMMSVVDSAKWKKLIATNQELCAVQLILKRRLYVIKKEISHLKRVY